MPFDSGVPRTVHQLLPQLHSCSSAASKVSRRSPSMPVKCRVIAVATERTREEVNHEQHPR